MSARVRRRDRWFVRAPRAASRSLFGSRRRLVGSRFFARRSVVLALLRGVRARACRSFWFRRAAATRPGRRAPQTPSPTLLRNPPASEGRSGSTLEDRRKGGRPHPWGARSTSVDRSRPSTDAERGDRVGVVSCVGTEAAGAGVPGGGGPEFGWPIGRPNESPPRKGCSRTPGPGTRRTAHHRPRRTRGHGAPRRTVNAPYASGVGRESRFSAVRNTVAGSGAFGFTRTLLAGMPTYT